MTGSAKQFIATTKATMDCFVASLLAMTSAYDSAFPRRDAPELCMNFFAQKDRGRGECRVPDAPAASCAKVESTRVSHHGRTGTPGIPARNGFNGFLRALRGDRLVVTVIGGLRQVRSPVGPTCLRQLDASAGASGPHDFAVRKSAVRLRAGSIAHGKTALRSNRARGRCRVHRIPPRVRDVRTPLCEVGRRGI
jgi:hypothetical protein